MTKAEKVAWENSSIHRGFEIYYRGEDNEAEARKKLLPHIKKLFLLGYRINRYIEKHKK